MTKRALLMLALLSLATACTRTAVEPLGRPYIRQGAGHPLEPPAPPAERAGPVGTPLSAGATAAPSSPWAGPALAVHHHPDVLRYLERFSYQQQASFRAWLERRARYEAMILPRLAAQGVPADMIHLALIESGYVPDARSKADAVGMWQFIESTARLEGLEVSAWVDDRRDPVRATEAAARHLAALYQRFGSWYLAAAAYNAGSGRIERALDAHAGGARGADSLFWIIQPALPQETREYVPKLIAAAIVGRAPASFGLPALPPAAEPAVDTVLVSDAVELAEVARLAGLDAGVVRSLNGRYVRGATPPGRSAPLLLPRGTGAPFLAALAASPAPSLVDAAAPVGVPVRPAAAGAVPLVHRVEPGESVWSIGRRYGIHPSDLLRWNRLTLESVLRPGDRLHLVPPG